MIKEAIKNTALTTARANEYFAGSIVAADYREDVSMTATCRALFGPRLKDGEKITVTNKTIFWNGSLEAENLKQEIAQSTEGSLFIYGVTARKEQAGQWVSEAKRILSEAGLFEMDDVENWFASGNTTTVIYTNRPHEASNPKSPVDNTKTVIFVENMTISRWHTVEIMLKRLLSKWFTEQPLTPEESAGFINSLYKDELDTYLAAVQAYASGLDLRAGFIRKALAGFETRFEKERLKQLEKESVRLEEQMDDLSRRIGELLHQKEDILSMLYGYQVRGVEAEPYVMNYFLANKNLVLKSVTGDSLEFFAFGWLDNWDPEKAKATFAQDHMSSWLQNNRDFGISNADAKLLYKAMFVEETVKVQLWSHYRLALRGDSPANVVGHGECDGEVFNALPNPHHQYNSCLGQNRPPINEAMRTRDIVGAIAQCLSATKGINLTEQASYRHFAKDLFDPAFGEIIYVPALRKFLTTKNAIEYLKEVQNGKKTKKEGKAHE